MMRQHRAQEERTAAVRRQKHAEALERQRQVRRDYDDKVKGWMATPSGADVSGGTRTYARMHACTRM